LSGCVVSWGDLSRTANPKVGIRRKRQASRLSDRWRQRASQLKREVYALHFAVRDPSGAVVRQGPCGVRRRVCRQPDRPHFRSHPGPDAKLAPLIDELRAVVRFAGTLGELARDEAATASWRAVYGTLTREEPGMVGAVIGRAEVQVLRLSILYAVLDRSKEVLTPHLLAALALWEYAKASARRIFGDRMGDHVAEAILEALRVRGPLTLTGLHATFGRHRSAAELGAALARLEVPVRPGAHSRRRKADLPRCGRRSVDEREENEVGE
jgi:hypothetical protein